MKLAQIEHIRCNEQDAVTYVWIPDGMGEEELYAAVKAAQSSYLKAESDLKASQKVPNPGYGPRYEHYPKRVVQDVKNEFDQLANAWKEQELKVKNARRSFAEHLTRANATISLFWEGEFPVTTSLDWGHNHGTIVDYGETSISDLKGSAKEEKTGL